MKVNPRSSMKNEERKELTEKREKMDRGYIFKHKLNNALTFLKCISSPMQSKEIDSEQTLLIPVCFTLFRSSTGSHRWIDQVLTLFCCYAVDAFFFLSQKALVLEA